MALLLSIVMMVLSVFLIQFWSLRLPLESIKFNIIYNLEPWVNPTRVDIGTLQKSNHEEQIELLTAARLGAGKAATDAPYFFFGQEMADTYTQDNTRTVELLIPRSTKSTDDEKCDDEDKTCRSKSRNEEDEEDAGIPVTCVVPKSTNGKKLPLLIHYHSGGLILGSRQFEIVWDHWFSVAAQVVSCTPEYRMAPEHLYPAPIDDCMDVALALLNPLSPIHDQLGKDLGQEQWASNFGLFGLSAGGFLAGHASQLLAEKGFTAKIAVTLMPMVKPYGGTKSMALHGSRRPWTRELNDYAWSVLLKDKSLAKSWRVSLAIDPPQEVIDNMPPTLVQLATMDPLYTEGIMYAKRLEASGKLLELVEYETIHGGVFNGLNAGGPGEVALPKILAVLKSHLDYE